MAHNEDRLAPKGADMTRGWSMRYALVVAVVTVVAGAAGVTVVTVGARGQVGAGALADFKDLERWARTDPATGERERGLGLVLAGAGGQTRLAFVARGGTAADRSRTLLVQVFRSARASPTVVSRVIVRFVADAGTPQRRRVVDLSSRATAYPPGPGVPPDTVSAAITALELQHLAGARTIDVQLPDVATSLSAEQRRALQAFARSIGLGGSAGALR
jgi:hypothetical protein